MTTKIRQYTINAQGGTSGVAFIDTPAGGNAVWGAVTGTLSNQTDLQAALDGKQAAGTYATGTGTASGTNTGDQILPVASSTTPAPLGVADVGTGTTWARADHVHLLPTLATLGAQAAGTYATGTGTANGTNTGDQTNVSGSSGSCTGNAATATKLAATKTINGIAFDGSANVSIPNANRYKGITVVTGAVAATLSAANLVGGAIFQLTGTTARTFTLDTGANISSAFTTAFGAPAAGDVFEFMVANAATAAITVAGATGSTMANAVTVATLQSRIFRAINTGSNAWTIY